MKKHKTSMRRVPDEFHEHMKRLAAKFDVPTTQGYIITEKFLFKEFKAKKKKKGRGKEVYEVEFFDY